MQAVAFALTLCIGRPLAALFRETNKFKFESRFDPLSCEIKGAARRFFANCQRNITTNNDQKTMIAPPKHRLAPAKNNFADSDTSCRNLAHTCPTPYNARKLNLNQIYLCHFSTRIVPSPHPTLPPSCRGRAASGSPAFRRGLRPRTSPVIFSRGLRARS